MVPPDCKCRSGFTVFVLSHHTERGEDMRRDGDFHYDSGYGISDPVYSADALHGAGPALSDPFYPYDP